MDTSLLITGFVLFTMLPHTNSFERYWEEFSSFRNYLTDSEFSITTASSLYACMSHCTMTAGCCFISYIAVASVCVRHRTMAEYNSVNSSSVWYPLEDSGCPCGWSQFETWCFLIPNITLSWQDSVTYCQVLDSRLAEVDSGSKDAFIRGLAATRPDLIRYWIGGSDIVIDGTWVWITSGTPFNYTNWYPSQPDNFVDSDCLCLGSWYQFSWDDCPCYTETPFICEKHVT